MANMTWGKGADLLNIENVRQAMDEAARWYAGEQERTMRGFFRFFISSKFCDGGLLESPIEAIFAVWFNAVAELTANEISRFGLLPQQTVTLSSGKTCRFDFTVLFGPQNIHDTAAQKGIPMPKVAIELDGHDFHERTKEQVAHRNERDREAQADGWRILHFSGSELYRDPVKCSQEVLAVCTNLHDAWLKAIYPF